MSDQSQRASERALRLSPSPGTLVAWLVAQRRHDPQAAITIRVLGLLGWRHAPLAGEPAGKSLTPRTLGRAIESLAGSESALVKYTAVLITTLAARRIIGADTETRAALAFSASVERQVATTMAELGATQAARAIRASEHWLRARGAELRAREPEGESRLCASWASETIEGMSGQQWWRGPVALILSWPSYRSVGEIMEAATLELSEHYWSQGLRLARRELMGLRAVVRREVAEIILAPLGVGVEGLGFEV